MKICASSQAPDAQGSQCPDKHACDVLQRFREMSMLPISPITTTPGGILNLTNQYLGFLQGVDAVHKLSCWLPPTHLKNMRIKVDPFPEDRFKKETVETTTYTIGHQL